MKRFVVQPGAFPRARARELERAWLGQNWPVLALGAFGLVLVVVTLFLFLCLFWEQAWAAGTAGVLAGVAGTLLVNLVQAESGGLTRRQGADSEEFAHAALCKLEKKGWQVRSAVSFADGDVDHIVIGCDRVLVVETKHSNADWRLTSSGIRLPSSDPLIQVNQNLARVQRFLTGRRSVDLPGEALLVMRGHAAAQLGDRIESRGDVAIMNLKGLRRYVRDLPPVDRPEQAAAWASKLDQYLEQRLQHQRKISDSRTVDRPRAVQPRA